MGGKPWGKFGCWKKDSLTITASVDLKFPICDTGWAK